MGVAAALVGEGVEYADILGPIRIANQAVVSGSSLTMVLALERKFATSCSLPGLASS